jgi:hypothetical protein
MFGIESDGARVSDLTIESVVAILKEKKSFLLSQDVEKFARFVSFDNGTLRLNFNDGAPRELLKNLNQFFAAEKYGIEVVKSDDPGDDTIREKAKKLFDSQVAEISGNPILKEILSGFKDSYIAKIEEMG